MRFVETQITDLLPENLDISTCEKQDLISIAAYWYDQEYQDVMTKPCYKHPTFTYEWLNIFKDAAEQSDYWTYKIDGRGVASLVLNPLVYTTVEGKEYTLTTTVVAATLRYNSTHDTFTFTADFGDSHYHKTMTTEFLAEILLPPTEKPEESTEEPISPTDEGEEKPEPPAENGELEDGGEEDPDA